MATYDSGLEIVPSGKALGADVRGIDLNEPMDDDVFGRILDAWHRHLVLRIRDQGIDDDALVAFAQRFGRLHSAAGEEYGGKPEGLHAAVELISNIVENGRPIGALGAGEATWHTDMSIFEVASTATLLYGEEIPATGGNTFFTNLYRAHDTLPEDLGRLVENRRSLHDAAYLATGGVRGGYEAVTDKSQGPGARHPIVKIHSATGRKALYLGRMGFGYIEGLTVDESDEALAALWAHMTRPEFVWEQVWQTGDLIIWDNRCVAHARGAFDPSARRLMRRVTVMEA